jgi:hypothetical protein
MTCAVQGCEKAAKVKGWCNPHYQRWIRHGDPVGGRTAQGEPLKFLQDVVLAYKGDDCLIWPYVKNQDGYGQMKVRGKMETVSRIVCEIAHGMPPSPNHEAAHSCGNGDKGCCTQEHLRWATTKENFADRLKHGTYTRGERHPMVKLTEADVHEIRRLRGSGVPLSDLADRFSVTNVTISQIARRKTWIWLEEERII